MKNTLISSIAYLLLANLLTGCFTLTRSITHIERSENYGKCDLFQIQENEFVLSDSTGGNCDNLWFTNLNSKTDKNQNIRDIKSIRLQGFAPWQKPTVTLCINGDDMHGSTSKSTFIPDISSPHISGMARIARKRYSHNPFRYLATVLTIPIDIIANIVTSGMHGSIGYGKSILREESEAIIEISVIP